MKYSCYSSGFFLPIKICFLVNIEKEKAATQLKKSQFQRMIDYIIVLSAITILASIVIILLSNLLADYPLLPMRKAFITMLVSGVIMIIILGVLILLDNDVPYLSKVRSVLLDVDKTFKKWVRVFVSLFVTFVFVIVVLGEVFSMLSVMNTKTIEGDVVKVVKHASVDTDKQLTGIKIKKDNGDVMELQLPSEMANVVEPNTHIKGQYKDMESKVIDGNLYEVTSVQK